MKKLKLIILIITATLFGNCSNKILNFSIISSKNVELSKAATFVKGKEKIEGKDIAHIIIIFPTGMIDFNKAMDNAINSIPGCVALLNGTIYSKAWFIPPMAQICLEL